MRFAALCLLLVACSSGPKARDQGNGSDSRQIAVFATADVRGQIEPCGCTSDPMGDLARTVELIEAARAQGPTLYVDAGSLLYSEPTEIPAGWREQETRKAALLAEAVTKRLDAAAIGLGPYDLPAGVEAVTPPRQAANVEGGPTAPPKVVEVGGVKVGVFGVVDPELLAPHGVKAGPAQPAAERAVATLRAAGAEVVIGLLQMDWRQAEALAGAVDGIDFAVVGAGAPEPDEVRHAPEQAGDTWLVQPANRGQVVSRIDLGVRGAGDFADAVGAGRAAARIEELDAQLARLKADLERWQSDPNADPAFVKTQQQEVARIEAERAALADNPLRKPATGNWFTLSQVRIKKQLPCDEAIVQAKVAYDEAVGAANLETATAEPPALPEGAAGFVGDEECSFCHKEAVEFWNTTKHARAWKTLVDAGKQYNLECIYCHVTGFEKPGGSVLGMLADDDAEPALRDVQCEVCHGPGSLHVDADGKESPSSLTLTTPESRCLVCHNELHSDTFQYEAYLRDVTGEGHGAAFRAKLGDGPTGLELRSAALKKAGEGIGKGCPK